MIDRKIEYWQEKMISKAVDRDRGVFQEKQEIEAHVVKLNEDRLKEARVIWNKVIRCEKYFFQTLSSQYLID